MGFLEEITEKENAFLREYRHGGVRPLYIYGAGGGGHRLAALLEQNNIPYAGIVVSHEYASHEMPSIEDVLSKADGQVDVAVAFRDYREDMIAEQYRGKIARLLHGYDCWGMFSLEESGRSAYEWVAEHEGELQRTFERLADDLSRETFLAFWNQVISMKYYLPAVKAENHYFPDDIMRLGEDEVFVDCGAYDGDTAVDFVEALKRQGISTYSEIVSLEPDDENYGKLVACGLPNHICLKKGVSDAPGILRFVKIKAQDGGYIGMTDKTESRLDQIGETEVEVDTVDRVTAGKNVTMIKADIEGSELAMLRGAKETIRRCHPKLAICVYHKERDLIEIPHFIMNIDSRYRLFLRAYEDVALDLVLYAI